MGNPQNWAFWALYEGDLLIKRGKIAYALFTNYI